MGKRAKQMMLSRRKKGVCVIRYKTQSEFQDK